MCLCCVQVEMFPALRGVINPVLTMQFWAVLRVQCGEKAFVLMYGSLMCAAGCLLCKDCQEAGSAIGVPPCKKSWISGHLEAPLLDRMAPNCTEQLACLDFSLYSVVLLVQEGFKPATPIANAVAEVYIGSQSVTRTHCYIGCTC